MVITCCVYGCGSKVQENGNLKFHRFPRDERCQIWIDACQKPELNDKNIKQLYNMYVCSLHFERWMYMTNKLKKTAIPILNLPSASIRVQSKAVQSEAPKIEIVKDLHSRGIQHQTDTTSVAVSVETCSNSQTTQTANKLTEHTPRKGKLLKKQIISFAKRLKLIKDAKSTEVTREQFFQEKQQKKTCTEQQKNTCDSCRKSWVWGFVYRCIQCDHQLCSACDVAGVHRFHYVLRVPMNSPKEKTEEVLRKVRKAISEIPFMSSSPKNHEAVQAQLSEDIGVQDVGGQHSHDQDIGDQEIGGKEIGGQDIGDQHGQDIAGSDSIDINTTDDDKHVIEMPFEFKMEFEVEEHDPFEGISHKHPEQVENRVPRPPDLASRLSSPSVAPSPSVASSPSVAPSPSVSGPGLSITQQTSDMPAGTYIKEEPVASDDLYTSDLSASQVDLNPVIIKNEPPDTDQPSTSAGASSQQHEYLVPSAKPAKRVKVDSAAVPKKKGRSRRVMIEFEEDD